MKIDIRRFGYWFKLEIVFKPLPHKFGGKNQWASDYWKQRRSTK